MGHIRIAPAPPGGRVTVRNDCRCGVDHAAVIDARARVDQQSGCWLWALALNSDGYGYLKHDGAVWPAHRLSHVAHIGPIQPGLVIDHLCRNHACVNPDHLEAVTNHVNILRGDSVAKSAPEGILPAGDPRHGVNGYVNLGCRCLACRQANTDRHREYMRRRRAAKRATKAV